MHSYRRRLESFTFDILQKTKYTISWYWPLVFLVKAVNVISAEENGINITMNITASMLLSTIVLVDVF